MDLYLRKGAERRVRAGHLWIYSNEVDSQRSSLGGFASGDCVLVRSAGGELLGSAWMEPGSLICARLYAPRSEQPFDRGLVTARLAQALAVREEFFDDPYYRLVYGDSDGLPGVVVDRFGAYLVLQLHSAGLEQYADELTGALVDMINPAGVLLRGDSRSRREQGEAAGARVSYGDVPRSVPLIENSTRFSAPVYSGQKTGWFYDHRLSRALLGSWVRDAAVLDVYSYVGAWGVQAAARGASAVTCVDSSAPALEQVEANAALNDVQGTVTTLRGAASEVMTDLAAAGSRYDVVVLDPPAFIQRRKDLKKGIAGYRRINEQALRLLRPGGMLVSASCSMHLQRADLLHAVQQAAVRAGCAVQLLAQGGQGPDHPVHPAIAETEYLKALFLRRCAE